MKLTLRTLLAYIDNLLPASTTEEFEAALNESEVANNLCKRIRTVMVRPELGAPDVLDKGPLLDPNITADYLDNVLNSTDAPGFEKLCINSDRQLAEVGACHQILTVVQVEPAEVDPAWREDIYRLPERLPELETIVPDDQLDYSPSGSGVGSGIGSGVGSGTSKSGIRLGDKSGIRLGSQSGVRLASPSGTRLGVGASSAPLGENLGGTIGSAPQEPPIPSETESATVKKPPISQPSTLEDYAQMIAPELQTTIPPEKSNLKLILAVCAAVAVTAICMFFLLRGGSSQNNIATNAPAEQTTPQASPENVSVPEQKNQDDSSSSNTTPADSETSNQNSEDGSAVLPDEIDNAQPVLKKEPETEANPVAIEEAVDSNGTTPEPVNTEASEEPSELPADSAEAIPVAVPNSDYQSPEIEETPDDSASVIPPPTREGAALEENVQPEAQPLNPAVRIAQFKGREKIAPQILLQRPVNDKNGVWTRIKEFSGISSGTSLMVFPEYRPDIEFGPNMRARLVGPAILHISPDSTPTDMKINLEYGRLILSTDAAFDRHLTITTSDMPTQITISEPKTRLTIKTEISSNKPSGDPTDVQPPIMSTATIVSGSINLKGSNDSKLVDIPAHIDCKTGTLNPIRTQDPSEELDGWVKVENLPRPDLEKRLSEDKPISTLLKEYASEKINYADLRENTYTALAMIGAYKTLADEFSKPQRVREGETAFKALQNAILQGTEYAKAVKKAITDRYGAEDGLRIYEMLWKYQGSLDKHTTKRLIDDLDSDKPHLRVAAFCLMRNRNLKLFSYTPDNIEKSKISLKKISEEYSNGIE